MLFGFDPGTGYIGLARATSPEEEADTIAAVDAFLSKHLG